MDPSRKRINTDQACVACGNKAYYSVYEKAHQFAFCNDFDQRVVVCANCGLSTVIFNDGYSDENLADYYRNVPRTPFRFEDLKPDDPRMVNARKRVDFIQEFTTGKRLLEIGIGDGLSLLEANRKGYNATGIDISEDYAALYDHLRAEGISVVHADFNDHVFDERFDVVSAFLVFEHVKHPDRFIGNVKKQLADGGHLVLEVPNLANYHRFYSETMMTHEHLFHYTPETLALVLQSHGFTMTGHWPEGTGYGFSLTASFQYNEGKASPELALPGGEKSAMLFDRYFSSLDRYRSELKNYMAESILKYKRFYAFGAGGFFELLVKLGGSEFVESLVAVIDETPSKIGTSIHGLPIVPVSDMPKNEPIAVLIASEAFTDQIEKRLLTHNASVVAIRISPEVLKRVKDHA